MAFRLLRRADLPLLSDWFSRPHVEQWWLEEYDPISVENRYGPCIDGVDPTEVFIVEIAEEPAGMVQRYLIDDDPAWKAALVPSGVQDAAAGIDYLIGEEAFTGGGLGPTLIGRFVAATWPRYPMIRQIVVAVQQGNRRSWRALEKAGFERAWAGRVESDDPSDKGPSYVYVRRRPLGP